MQKQQHRIAAMVVAGTLLASSGQFAVANVAEKETEQAPATSTQGSSNLAHSTFKSETPEVQPYGVIRIQRQEIPTGYFMATPQYT